MSQYGAYGAARSPYLLSSQQILDFYYPGTRTGSTGGKVAVLISADDDGSLVVADRGGLTARSLANGRTVKLREPKAKRWRITPAGTRSEIAYKTRRWHTLTVLRGDAEIAAGGRPVALRTPDGTVSYRGALRSTHHAGDRVTVNVLPMEKYVAGVVPSEVAALRWPQQALRAQAVASRTYAAYERAHGGNAAYDLCDTAACQAYGGASAEFPSSDDAVRATARRVLTYQGELAFAQFSASNGGWTAAGQFPYLPAQEDPYEGSSSDYYGWTETVTSAAIEKAYHLENLTSLQIETRDGNGPRGGRVTTVRLQTEAGFDGTVTGDSFRRNLGLRSTLLEITGVAAG
nr:SpoIID/LytB domain-containing protein [Nocardioides luti]